MVNRPAREKIHQPIKVVEIGNPAVVLGLNCDSKVLKLRSRRTAGILPNVSALPDLNLDKEAPKTARETSSLRNHISDRLPPKNASPPVV